MNQCNEFWNYYSNHLYDSFENFNGYTLPIAFGKFREHILDLHVRDEDVWVVTFPKSGTTWMQEMVWMILNNLDFENGVSKVLGFRSPFVELTANFDYFCNLTGKSSKLPEYLTDSLGFIKKMYEEEPRLCVKSHLPWELLPKQIQEGIKKPKIIYITRNVKDTCVSYYWHAVRSGYTGTFDHYCKSFITDKVSYSPYWSHVRSFWNQRNQPNILCLTYEELKEDLQATIRKVSTFIEKPLTHDEILRLANHLSFENMKKNPSVNYENSSVFTKTYFPASQEISFIRKGTVGSYKEMMSQEMIEKFDKWTEANSIDGL